MRILVLMLFLMLANVARADYRDYAKGVEAAEKSEWSKVEQLVGSAFADDPVAKERARLYGQYFRPYIPQYYLALAAFQRQDCTTAMKYLNDARYLSVVGVAGKAKEEARQEASIRSRCATPISSTTTTTTTTTPPPPPPASLSAAERASATRALEQLQQALAGAERAKVVETQLAPVRGRVDAARKAIEAAVAAADAARLQQALANVPNTLTELGRLTQAATVATTTTTTTTTPPPPPARLTPAPALRNALTAYFAADYNAVLAVNVAGMDATSAAHTHLLRAAARYSLYVLGGETDAGQRTQAETEIRNARRNLAAIRANPKYFSPRFVELFERTR